MASASDETIVHYLLGRLPEAECVDFEDRYFTDDALHEQLLAVEEELVDAYIHDALSNEDRAAFESHFLTSEERRGSVAFARELAESNRRYSGRPRWKTVLARWIPASTGFRVALAGFAAALVATALIWSSRWGRPVVEVRPTVTGEQRPNPSVPAVAARPPESTRPESPPVPALRPLRIVAFVLTPSIRSESRTAFSISAGADRVRLDLRLDSLDYGRYEAVLEDRDGNVIARAPASVEPQGALDTSSVSFTIEARLLRAGDYIVKLSGVAPDGSTDVVAGYSFRVR